MKESVPRKRETALNTQGFLPDFCANRVVFLIVVIAELLALMLVLASARSLQEFWLDLALVSLFIQWVALGSAAALCFGGRRIDRLSTGLATVMAYGLTQLVTLLFSIVGLWVMQGYGFRTGQEELGPIAFVVRNLALSSIVSLVALRYFYVQQQWQRNVEAEARARLQALQARMRPHFLFNSLNTVVSLIRNRPEQAEQAVIDLASLFRRSLEQKAKISLDEELEITRRYLRLEGLRLGERLQVVWDLDEDLPMDALVPALTLQPLAENAVYHGIQALTEGGRVTIQIKRSRKGLHFAVSNPLPLSASLRRPSGNCIAQDNIRERLMLAYGAKVDLKVQETEGHYRVSFTIPVEAAR
jgi:two-component system sensor histidine kinase AlgZ